MALRRRRARPDRLRVHVAGGESWRTELPAGTLGARFVAPLEGAAELRWEVAAQLDLGELREHWPSAAPLPERAYLTRAGRRGGDALDAEYPAGEEDAQDLGAMLREALLGIEPLSAEDAAAQAASDAPSAVEAEAPVDAEFEPLPKSGGATDEAAHAAEAAGDGPFAAAGAVDGDDDRRVRAEDLAWLNPGDLLRSERRGRLRIKRVEDEARQVLARTDSGATLAIGFDELVGECCFED